MRKVSRNRFNCNTIYVNSSVITLCCDYSTILSIDIGDSNDTNTIECGDSTNCEM